MAIMQWQGEWQAGAQYGIGDVVSYAGGVFTATSSPPVGTPPPGSPAWAVVTTGVAWVGVYNSAATYRVGDAVAYDGSSYVAIQGVPVTTPPPDTSYWNPLALQGAIGPPGGIGVTWRGQWDKTIAYAVGDAVEYQTADYVATKAPPVGDPPTDTAYWVILAQYPPAQQTAWSTAQIIATTTGALSLLISGMSAVPAWKQMITNPLGDLEKIVNDAGGLVDKMANLEPEVTGLKNQVGKLEADTNGLKNQVGKLEADTDGLKNEVGDLDTAIDGLKDQVGKFEAAINGEVEGLKSNINDLFLNNAQKVNALSSRLDTLEDAVRALAQKK